MLKPNTVSYHYQPQFPKIVTMSKSEYQKLPLFVSEPK